MNNAPFFGLAILCCTLAAACGGSDTPVAAPGAERIQVSTAMPADLKCRPLGDVMGEATGTDQAETVSQARVDIRNKALAMGATRVLLETNNSQPVYSFMVQSYKTVLTGSAFECEAEASSSAKSPKKSDTTTEESSASDESPADSDTAGEEASVADENSADSE